MNQVSNNEANARASDTEELQLLDAYSLATNFFLFLLIIVLTLTKPDKAVSTPIFILLVALATYSAAMFCAFTVLMFKPKKMSWFREFLSYSPKSRIRRNLRITFVVLLWFSLPITFLAGIVDASSNIPERWRTIVQLTGFSWLLVVPLAAMMVLSFKRKWRFKLNVPELIKVRAFCTKSWQNAKTAILKEGPLQFLLIAIAVGAVQMSAFLIPAFQWLPEINETDSFLKVLWQVHASILGVTVVVVTIIITVIANEKDRTRTWKLYAEKTKFVPVICFNLLAIISEGLASLQASHAASPIFSSDKIGNLILSEGILLISSIVMAAMLFTVTVRFLDDDYVEDLAEKRIMRAIPGAVEQDLKRIQELVSRLRGGVNGH